MSEPRLEDIGDYDTLQGEKKKVVWAVVLAGLVMGLLYSFAYTYYDNSDDTIQVEETVKNMPMR